MMLVVLAWVGCLALAPPAFGWNETAGHAAAAHSVWSRADGVQAQHEMSRVDLVNQLTDPERYNRYERPLHGQGPVNISARSFIYIVQSSEGRLHLQLKMSMQLLLGFRDPRLRFAELSPGTRELAGSSDLHRLLWTPHVFLSNERHSLLMASGPDSDVLVRVRPDGYVLFVTRFTVTVVCTMKSGRFPFDQQECPMRIESWLDDADDLVLRWAEGGKDVKKDAERRAITLSSQLVLNSFSLKGWRTEGVIRTKSNVSSDVDADRFSGRYWSLELTFMLSRQYGFFIMDYYLPSVLLVVISWVTFWLDPDVVPARVLLGSSTMLTFITLAVQTDDSLPRSYVKASEIWFVGCCTFIFGSLVEFAFVNTIWRQGQSVELKKVSTKHILRSTLGTTRPPRRRLLPQERYARRRTSSLPDLFKPHLAQGGPGGQGGSQDDSQSHQAYYNTIHAGGTLRPSPLASVSESVETLNMDDDMADTASEGSGKPGVTFHSSTALDHDSKLPPQVAGTRRQSLAASAVSRFSRLAARLAACNCGGYGHRIAVTLTPGFTRMSAQEVSDWIDRRSRVFFPLAFFVFNCVYWTFVIWF